MAQARHMARAQFPNLPHKLQKDGRPYPEEFNYLAAPVYTLVFISFLWIAGGYKKPFRVKPIPGIMVVKANL